MSRVNFSGASVAHATQYDKIIAPIMTSLQQQTELEAARAALDASYRADLADPAYGPYMRISQRTHKLWLKWSQLQLARPRTQERDT